MKKTMLSEPGGCAVLFGGGIVFSVAHLVCYVTAARTPQEEPGLAVLSLLLTGLLLLLCLMTSRLHVSQVNQAWHKRERTIAGVFLVLQGISGLVWLHFGLAFSTGAGGLSLGIFGLMGSATFLVFCLSALIKQYARRRRL